jgi:hypothetical protein
MAALSVGLAAPTGASAGLVDDLVNGVNDTVNGVRDTVGGLGGGGGASPAPAPQAGTPPTYTPPAHGTGPHAQGTGAVVDLVPEDSEPLPYEPGGGSEDVTAGRSRGEQNGDEYHGHVSILTLLGLELVPGADTSEGETESGPLGPLNDLLDDVCTNSGNALCLNVLDVHSETTSEGSTNSFAAANVGLNLGPASISADAVTSKGNISETDDCQTASSGSQLVGANVLGLTADAAESESKSKACNDGTETQENSGQVLNIGGTQVPIPPGCETGDPNTNFVPLAPLVSAVCNADDSNGSQAEDPYGVREALSVFLLDLGGTPLVKATSTASESRAVAPGGDTPECPDPSNPDCPEPPACPDPGDPSCPGPDGPDGPNGPNGPDGPGHGKGPGGGPGGSGPSGESPDDNLPFTGADVLALALIGGGVMGIGLLGMALADRRRKAQV